MSHVQAMHETAPKRTLAGLLAVVLVVLTGHAVADADGPDYFRIVGVPTGGTLSMHAGPGETHDPVGGIPSGTDGIANFGCLGGLDFEAWSAATPAERQQAAQQRWCLVGFDRVVGWVAGPHLAEGAGPDAFRGGASLRSLAGSEWVQNPVDHPVGKDAATITFKADGRVIGSTGCNRFTGTYSESAGRLSLGLLAMTQRACAPEVAQVETRMIAVLGAASRHVATHLVLALLDAQDEVLAQFTRADWD